MIAMLVTIVGATLGPLYIFFESATAREASTTIMPTQNTAVTGIL